MYTSFMSRKSEIALLRTAKLRATTPRRAVLSQLLNAQSPLSADKLFILLRNKKIDRVTIYRSLQVFTQAGLVRQIDLKRGHMLYEMQDEHDHHHLVCVACGVTEDFTGCNIDSLVSRTLQASKSFTSISEHSLELFGTCNSCTRV